MTCRAMVEGPLAFSAFEAMNRACTREGPPALQTGPPRPDAGTLGGYAKANLKRETPRHAFEEASAQLSTNHASDDCQRFG
jgi:hypothetical protein